MGRGKAKPSQAEPSQPSWVSKSIYIKASHSKFRCRLETCNYRIWYMIIFVRLKMPHHTSLTHTQLLKHQPNRWKPIIFSEKLFDSGQRTKASGPVCYFCHDALYIFKGKYCLHFSLSLLYFGHAQQRKPFFSGFCCTT